MKKTYINPIMNVVKIATQQMLASSGPVSFDGSGSGTIDLFDETPDDSEEAMGREEDDWF